MDTVITIGDAGLILIGIAVLVLLFYLINLVRQLIPTIKTLNKVLADTDKILESASVSVDNAGKIMTEVSDSVSIVSDVLKGNRNVIQSLTGLFNSALSLKNLFRR